ncbi:hypothetical protein [Streptomyces nodosus]|uniref:hypothetical protein n=1 Tax=Streptomyces nodosus TaxID=40318 RepID=UPI003826DE87
MLVGLAVFVLCGIGALIALLGVIGLALPGRPQPWQKHLVHRAAWLTASAAGAVYGLGLASVLASEHEFGNGADSIPAPACRDGFDEATVQHLSHHRASYLPLRFDCVRDDGTVYASSPGYTWLNGLSFTLAVCCALLVIGSGYATELRARREARVSAGAEAPRSATDAQR